MSYTVTKYPAGTFSWADVASTDIEATKTFMTSLLGWTAKDLPTEEGKPDYTMFYLDGKIVAGGAPSYMKGMPSFWSSYVTVENVDESAQKAKELGGKVVMPAMDVMNAGRMAGIQDPTGATVFIWQPKNHIGASIVNTVGAMCWNELYTRDIEKAKTFYNKLFGWEFEKQDVGFEYWIIRNNGRRNGGAMTIPPEMGDMPPNWMVYFTVKNADEAATKVKELGGTVHKVEPISIGKICVISDPANAALILLEFSMKPEEWVNPQ